MNLWEIHGNALKDLRTMVEEGRPSLHSMNIFLDIKRFEKAFFLRFHAYHKNSVYNENDLHLNLNSHSLLIKENSKIFRDMYWKYSEYKIWDSLSEVIRTELYNLTRNNIIIPFLIKYLDYWMDSNDIHYYLENFIAEIDEKIKPHYYKGTKLI